MSDWRLVNPVAHPTVHLYLHLNAHIFAAVGSKLRMILDSSRQAATSLSLDRRSR
ncbi:hypothetical protein L798_01864 [Zootermopsis nevadensis]|uniref:Uncharacterized protein n=1 Tax=Zootermopsis nevadensis TaxID=136037 RepID=A0A067RPL0_ZOONE|nr:hypothetical protein L798_01864 [Zootermopsis nevadensis]